MYLSHRGVHKINSVDMNMPLLATGYRLYENRKMPCLSHLMMLSVAMVTLFVTMMNA